MNTLVSLAGRYEVRGRLGYGGMAEVRDGWDTRLNRPVAIKLLHAPLAARPDLRSRFDAEARAAAALNHPNIVAVHDSGEHNGTPFIVMERLPGETLADRIARCPLPQAQVRAVLDDVLAALTAAHRAAILHRDIKPGNILTGPERDVMKVADFGIAKTPEAAHTVTGEVVGTMAYLSPQRLAGAPACAADDLYAAGVVGYEALAGRRPFPHDNVAALARAILHDRPPPLAQLRPDADPGLIAVIERAMAPDPHQRFGSAEEMRAVLHRQRAVDPAGAQVAAQRRPPTKVLNEPLPPITNAYVPPMDQRTASRRNKLLTALALLGLLILVPLAFAFDPAPSHAPTQPATTGAPSPASVSNPPPPAPTTESPPAAPPHNPPGPPGKGHGKGKGGAGD